MRSVRESVVACFRARLPLCLTRSCVRESVAAAVRQLCVKAWQAAPATLSGGSCAAAVRESVEGGTRHAFRRQLCGSCA